MSSFTEEVSFIMELSSIKCKTIMDFALGQSNSAQLAVDYQAKSCPV